MTFRAVMLYGLSEGLKTRVAASRLSVKIIGQTISSLSPRQPTPLRVVGSNGAHYNVRVPLAILAATEILADSYTI